MTKRSKLSTRQSLLIAAPAAAQAFIENQADTWAKIVKANDIKED